MDRKELNQEIDEVASDPVDRLLQGYAEQYDLQQIDSVPARQTSPVLFILRKTEKNE